MHAFALFNLGLLRTEHRKRAELIELKQIRDMNACLIQLNLGLFHLELDAMTWK